MEASSSHEVILSEAASSSERQLSITLPLIEKSLVYEYVPQRDELVAKLTWDVDPVKIVAEVGPGIAYAS
ncbi:uncharacterized protein A4U43_C04F16700 [Asparagus officinalis]|uniref:Uncharacterized protein n=1 Tax=Asparagus officinalis TaxID=4686 RepID=A0A5P1F634_ASPOF|nr:uncharacterized protein A4U43_C04F16700 [Asparagus officinalis]